MGWFSLIWLFYLLSMIMKEQVYLWIALIDWAQPVIFSETNWRGSSQMAAAVRMQQQLLHRKEWRLTTRINFKLLIVPELKIHLQKYWTWHLNPTTSSIPVFSILSHWTSHDIEAEQFYTGLTVRGRNCNAVSSIKNVKCVQHYSEKTFTWPPDYPVILKSGSIKKMTSRH